MKTTFQKLDPKIIHYRVYRKYCNDSFRQDLLSKLVMENINLSNGLQKFIGICKKTLDEKNDKPHSLNISEITYCGKYR